MTPKVEFPMPRFLKALFHESQISDCNAEVFWISLKKDALERDGGIEPDQVLQVQERLLCERVVSTTKISDMTEMVQALAAVFPHTEVTKYAVLAQLGFNVR